MWYMYSRVSAYERQGQLLDRMRAQLLRVAEKF